MKTNNENQIGFFYDNVSMKSYCVGDESHENDGEMTIIQ
jgi:hypothetical protein